MRFRGFALLDVILSIMILGVVVLTSLQAFHQSLTSLWRSEVAMRAAMYAEAKMEELELRPPDPGRISGSFADEPFYQDEELFGDASNFQWEAVIEEIEMGEDLLDYPHVRLARTDEDRANTVIRVSLRVIYDDGPRGHETWIPTRIDTLLLGNERFTSSAISENWLIFDER
jgi:hypothetical protein